MSPPHFSTYGDATFTSWLPLQVLNSALPVRKWSYFIPSLWGSFEKEPRGITAIYVPFALRFARVIFFLVPDTFRHWDCRDMCNTIKGNWFLSRFCHWHIHWYRNVKNVTSRRNNLYLILLNINGYNLTWFKIIFLLGIILTSRKRHFSTRTLLLK